MELQQLAKTGGRTIDPEDNLSSWEPPIPDLAEAQEKARADISQNEERMLENG